MSEVTETFKSIKQDSVRANRSISSGSVFIDLNINPRRPGFPTGKCHVVAGRPATGKSTLLMHAARALLDGNKGKPEEDWDEVVWIDSENGTTDEHFLLYGLTKYNTPGLTYKLTNYGPEIFSTLESLIVKYKGKNNRILVVIDSVPHISYCEDDDVSSYEKSAVVAEGPNKMREFFKRNKNRLASTNIAIFFLTFLTANIGRKYDWEPKWVVSGGSYLMFGADTLITLERKGQPRETEVPLKEDSAARDPKMAKFVDVKLHFEKNKCAAARDIVYTLCLIGDEEFRPGIQDVSLMVDYAISKRVVDMKGAWICYGDQKWQGRKAFKEAIRESARAAKLALEEGKDVSNHTLHTQLYLDIRKSILVEHNIKED